MIVNGRELLNKGPVKPMYPIKDKYMGLSFGLSEAGYDVRIKEYVELNESHRFQLASTEEEFDMPNDLVGVVHDKSTWARQGLSVFNTVIEPGWKGFLTLELVYHGSGKLIIPAGVGIAQILFHTIQTPVSYGGKYQNQRSGPVSARFD